MRSNERVRRAGLGAAALALAALSSSGCDPGVVTELVPADFYVTIQLVQQLQPQAVDRVELIVTNNSVTLEDLEGELYDGAFTWTTRAGATGDELVVGVTGEYFQRNAFETPGEFHELDVPFVGGLSGSETTFRIEASVYWADEAQEEHLIGFGTARGDFPLSEGSTITVEVDCPESDWRWTCLTGCGRGFDQCRQGVEQCDEGQDCVDECCVAGD